MSDTPSTNHIFIQHLLDLQDDRGALAALRRGLGQPPGAAADMYRYVVPYLPETAGLETETAYYTIASLFASYPENFDSGNMGNHFAHTLGGNKEGAEPVERRFTALLSAHSEDLPFYLRQAVSFLQSKNSPVCWNHLFKDMKGWSHPDHYVQRQWAYAFWRDIDTESGKSGNQTDPISTEHPSN
jgi:CRISPR system Cascade subunit CasB